MPDSHQPGTAAIPRVSIGVPVFNGERTIAAALEALRVQTFTDFEMIISDNGSTDGTAEICHAFTARDARVRYVRQPCNRGGLFNWKFLLDQARGPYFVWAAVDDLWAPTFLEENLRTLEADPGVVASMSKAWLLPPRRDLPPDAGGTYPLMGTPEQNVRRYLRDPQFNSRVYALYRTRVLRESVVWERLLGWDWLSMVRTLRFGKHYEVNKRLFTRNTEGVSSSLRRAVAIDCQLAMGFGGALHRVFPHWPLWRRLLKEPVVPKDLGTYVILLRWNGAYAAGIALERVRSAARFLAARRRTHKEK
jgi:glycosyltransferase involved in cell wall biosynthesis